jgi:4-azaleucine resistance transporter AzlC
MPVSNEAPIRFTRDGMAAGAVRSLPIATGALAFGVFYGFLAGQHGLTLLETALMSAWVFAGASQFLSVELWGDPLPVGALLATVLVINVRHVLMGATIGPWFKHVRPAQAYVSLFFLTDESWGLSVAEIRQGRRDAAFMLGSGLTLYLFWNTGTILGRVFGEMLPDLNRYGIDFLGTAFFVALLAGFWRGRSDLLPWTVAAAVALVMERFVGGTWYILGGALAGSLVGAWRHVR